MTSTQWLIVIYHAYPVAFVLDFITVQFILRFMYWRETGKRPF